MAELKTIALPIPNGEYDENDEAITRRILEQSIEDLNVKITRMQITFRLSVRVAGAGADDKQYLYYDKSVAANDSLAIVIGITLNQADVLKVYTSAVDMSFNVFGCETKEER